ncbi:MAG TPA: HAD family hydrolase [Candidatus Limnocylindria bacterium]|nr:HAD family hydrolase [Candidatus Limnocylindria bacterium]
MLWDLDGTLTDSVTFVVETANRIIAAHGGARLDVDRIGAMTGLPLSTIFALAWPDLAPDVLEGYVGEYREIYEREVIPATRLFRGARVTLRAFHRAGLLQATVTGKRAADCERILRGLRIRREIDAYLGGDSVTRHKPAPDLALAAAERLGVLPAACAVVGDAPADIEMARAAGMRALQIRWGYAKTTLPGADRLVRTWPELRRAVFGLAGLDDPILRGRGPLRS